MEIEEPALAMLEEPPPPPPPAPLLTEEATPIIDPVPPAEPLEEIQEVEEIVVVEEPLLQQLMNYLLPLLLKRPLSLLRNHVPLDFLYKLQTASIRSVWMITAIC